MNSAWLLPGSVILQSLVSALPLLTSERNFGYRAVPNINSAGIEAGGPKMDGTSFCGTFRTAFLKALRLLPRVLNFSRTGWERF